MPSFHWYKLVSSPRLSVALLGLVSDVSLQSGRVVISDVLVHATHKLGWLWATQNTTMEDLEVMVYLLLSLWIVVTYTAREKNERVFKGI